MTSPAAEPPAAEPSAAKPSERRGRDEASPICSSKGCANAAAWVLAWNNPRVHHPDRLKTWAACDDHRESLSDFLAARGFLKQVVRRKDWDASQG
ncbi:MAG: hypothetical protein ACTHNT_00890 [Actinomycetales bacterium]